VGPSAMQIRLKRTIAIGIAVTTAFLWSPAWASHKPPVKAGETGQMCDLINRPGGASAADVTGVCAIPR